MNSLVIASQQSSEINDHLRAALPDAAVVDIAPGLPPILAPEVEVLFVRPIFPAGAPRDAGPPAGWPFGVRWIQLGSSGADYYPDWLFDGPVVTSARAGTADAVAEFAMAAILAAAKHLPDIWISSREDWRWSRLGLLKGQVLGIVGFGAIGHALAVRARAFGMKVIAVRRTPEPLDHPGVERAENLKALFAAADHVVVAAPATARTHHLVGRDVLAAARPGLHLVNIARGSLVDSKALLDAVNDGRIGLATLDVTEVEPLPAGHPFYAHPRIRLSPHLSSITHHSAATLADLFLANLARYRQGAVLSDVVDRQRGY
ncbi:NAD(P)-dependent oxidoreductase [Thauera sinica]|uniref:NAD(P)-dependent oxidoreductase n=1 Tax=Thauera sinica TaxID=2665146 RepID=A0ABW1AMR9_9RHOO|nr:NAD(P)-dependent oxidoreductase [Thauera sp. K11]ATE60697.1 dihydrofolate reductase [Thauera sp. K11]